jgi:hypothetical protein
MKSPFKLPLSVLLLSETFLASNALSSNFNGRSQKPKFDATKGAAGESSDSSLLPSETSALPHRSNGWSSTPHVIGPDQWLNSVSLSRSPNYFPQSWPGPTNGRSNPFGPSGGNNSPFSQPSTTASQPPASNSSISNGQSPTTDNQVLQEKSQRPVTSTTSWTQSSILNGAMQADVIKKVGLYDYQTSNPWRSAEAQAARMAEQARNTRLLAEENVRRLKAEAEAEAKRLAEQSRKAAAEEEARAQKAAEEKEKQLIAAEEEKARIRKAAEEEERQRIVAAEEEARLRKAAAEEEAKARKAGEEKEKQRIAVEEEKARIRKAAEEKERQRIVAAEEEARLRKAAAEEEARARKAAEEKEKQRIAAEEEKARIRKAAEEEEARAQKAAEKMERQRIAAVEGEARLGTAAVEEEARARQAAADEEARARKAAEETERQRIAAVEEEEAQFVTLGAKEEAKARDAAAKEEEKRLIAAAEEQWRKRVAAEKEEKRRLQVQAEAETIQQMAEKARLARLTAEENVRRLKVEAEAEAARLSAKQRLFTKNGSLINSYHRVDVEDETIRSREAPSKEEENRRIAEEASRRIPVAAENEAQNSQAQAEAEAEATQMAEKVRNVRLRAEDNLRRLKVEAEAESARTEQQREREADLASTRQTASENSVRLLKSKSPSNNQARDARKKLTSLRPRPKGFSVINEKKKKKPKETKDFSVTEQWSHSIIAGFNSETKLENDSEQEVEEQSTLEKAQEIRSAAVAAAKHDESTRRTLLQFRLSDEAKRREIIRRQEEEKVEAEEARAEEETRLAAIATAKHDESTRRALLQFRLSDEAKRREIIRRQEEEKVEVEEARAEEETRLAAIAAAKHDESTRRALLQFRLSDEAKRREIVRRQEEEKVKAEKARAEEETRLAAIATAKHDESTRRTLLQFRLSDEAKRREIVRQQESEREKIETDRLREIARLEAIARFEEKHRLAEQARKEDEARMIAEARQQEIERSKQLARERELARLPLLARLELDTQMSQRLADSPWPTSTVVGSDESANGSNKNVNQTDPSLLGDILNATDGAGIAASDQSISSPVKQQPNSHSTGADSTSRRFSKSVYESMERENVKRGSLLSKSRPSPKRKVEQLSQSGRGFSTKNLKTQLKSKRVTSIIENDAKKVEAQTTMSAADVKPFSSANHQELSRQDLPRYRLLIGSNVTRTALTEQEAISEAMDVQMKSPEFVSNSGKGVISSVAKREEATRRGLLKHRLLNEASSKRAAQKIEETFTEIRDGPNTAPDIQARDATAKLLSIAKRQEATHRGLLQHRLLIEANRKQLAQQDTVELEKRSMNSTAMPIPSASDFLESAAKRQETTHRGLLQHRLMNDAISKNLSRSNRKESFVVLPKIRVNHTETPDRANGDGNVTSAYTHESNQRALLQYRLSSNSCTDTIIEVEKETKAKLAEEEAQAAVELAESILASIDETEVPTPTRKGASFVGSLLTNIERSKETGKLTIEVARGVFNIVSRFLKDVAKDHTPAVSVVNGNDLVLQEKEENARIAAEAARLAEEAARLEAARLKKIEEAVEARRKKGELSAATAAVQEDKEMAEHNHTKRPVPFFASLKCGVESH